MYKSCPDCRQVNLDEAQFCARCGQSLENVVATRGFSPAECMEVPRPTIPYGACGWLAIAAIVLVCFRLHAFSLPLETDECNYAYIGQRLLQGDTLYVDVWDHQPPGVFVMFAGLTALVGQSDAVIRWMATGFSLASLVLIFHIAQRHYGLESGVLAAAVFAIVSSDPGSAGEGCNREIYMNVFALAAVAALTRRDDRRYTLMAGLLLGISSTFKTVAAAQWLFLALWAVVRTAYRTRRIKPAIATLLWFGAGPALVWTGVFLYFAATDRWDIFIDAAFTYNLGYSGLERGLWDRYLDFATVKPYVFESARPLWIAAAIAFPAVLLLVLLDTYAAEWVAHGFSRGGLELVSDSSPPPLKRWATRFSGIHRTNGNATLGMKRLASTNGAILAYAFGSFQAVCLPGQFWPHYYYLLIPPAVLLCAILPQLVKDRLDSRFGQWCTRGVSYGWLLVVLWYALLYYLLVEPNQITAPRYDYRQQWARAQGLRVGKVTDPDDTIFVWGKDVGVYRYAHRRCASRYTMVGALHANARGYEMRRQTLLEELRSRRPRVVLLVEEEFEELRDFLQSQYVVAGVDKDDDNPDKVIMLALTDRNRPIEPVDWEWRAPKVSASPR